MSLTIPNLSRLIAIARRQFELAGQDPTRLNMFRRVNRLRTDEVRATTRGLPWLPLPPEDLAAIDSKLKETEDE